MRLFDSTTIVLKFGLVLARVLDAPRGKLLFLKNRHKQAEIILQGEFEKN